MSTYTKYHKNYYQRKHNDDYKKQALILQLHKAAFCRSIRDKHEFNITHDDIIVPEYCPYLKVKLVSKFDKGVGQHEPNKATIDRIDSTKGYIKGNIEVISLLANTMKNKATKEQLITFAKSILEREEMLLTND